MTIARLLFLIAGLAFATTADAQTRVVPSSANEMKLSFASVVRETAPAVVNIYATRLVAQRASPFAGDPFFSRFFEEMGRSMPRAQNSLGSGVILSPDGIVVSNHHVVGGATEIRVVLSDRREFDAEILLSDEEADVAVIRLVGASDLPALDFADSDRTEVGDLVLAIGNPFGVGQTVSSGIVSGLARNGGRMGDSAGYFIQTDAPINPGNSGGALVDMTGALIGVNTSILSRSGGSNGIGFAIPSNLVKQYVRQAEDGAKVFQRPWSGARVQIVDNSLAVALGLPHPTGVLVNQLHEQSPLAKAGLVPGDPILSIDGLPVNDAPELEFRLTTRGLGSTAVVEFMRDGEPDSIELILAVAPDIPGSEPVRIRTNSPFNGLIIADLSPRLVDDLNLSLDAKGVVVIGAEGYAARIGLRPGDRISLLNGTVPGSAAELEDMTRNQRSHWEMEIMRGGRQLLMRLRG